MRLINCLRKLLFLFAKRLRRNVMLGDLKEIFRFNRSIENKPCRGEEAFMDKWKVLDTNVSPLSYRFYLNYIGENIDIVPGDTARAYIEPILNQEENANFYNDKNSFDLFLDPNDMPKTLFRSIGYKLYDGEYNAVTPANFNDCFLTEDQVIVKPAKELGGRGIEFFERKKGVLINSDGTPLTLEYLTKNYHILVYFYFNLLIKPIISNVFFLYFLKLFYFQLQILQQFFCHLVLDKQLSPFFQQD